MKYELCTFISSFFQGTDSQAKFASLNLAIVLNNGSVWDISFDDKFMLIKKKLLIQLPKSNPYFPFSTNFKVLNFVRNDLGKDIVQCKLVVNIKKWVDINEYKYVCINWCTLAGKIDNMH